MEGNSLAEGNWETMDLTWQLREGGVFGKEAWTREIDGQTLDITNSARPSHSTQQAARRPRRTFCTTNSGEDMDDGDSSDEDDDDTSHDLNDELTLLDEDDSMDLDDETHGMEIQDGFCIQASLRPLLLTVSYCSVVYSLGWVWVGLVG